MVQGLLKGVVLDTFTPAWLAIILMVIYVTLLLIVALNLLVCGGRAVHVLHCAWTGHAVLCLLGMCCGSHHWCPFSFWHA